MKNRFWTADEIVRFGVEAAAEADMLLDARSLYLKARECAGFDSKKITEALEGCLIGRSPQ